MDEPPKVPIFTGCRVKKSSQVEVLTTAVTEMAKAMTTGRGKSPLPTPSPSSSSVSSGTGISPGKIANLRSNYLQQMRDLHLLYESGALTNKEFCEQKVPILDQLKKMSPLL